MRKESVTIRCDGDGCKNLVDVEKMSETPANWYRVNQADENGKVQPNVVFDLCSIRCIEKWSKARRIALNGSGKLPGQHRAQVFCPECEEVMGAQGLPHHYKVKHPDATPLSELEVVRV